MTDTQIDAPSSGAGGSLLVSGVAELHSVMDQLTDAQATFVPTDTKATLLCDLVRAQSRMASLMLRVLADAGDVAERDGARHAGAWLAAHTTTDTRTAHGLHRLAEALERNWTRTGAALAAGEVTLPQAEAIVDALIEVTDDLDADQLATAEQVMLEAAVDVQPAGLRRIGRHLADVVDPETAAAREAQRLAEAEKRAAERARLSLRPQGDGTTRLSGILPDAVAHRLEKTLDSFAQPRKQAAVADGLRAPRHRLLAHALGDLLERLDPTKLPHHGGDATTVIVTMTLDQLRSGLGSALVGFDQDTPITPEHARRLACEANLIPWVLGGAGQVLDAGRTARLHNPMQRKVVRHRDRHCRAAGCDVPAEWCDIHHWTRWVDGGRTNTADAGCLCSHHHQRIHDPAYAHRMRPDGQVTFTKRR